MPDRTQLKIGDKIHLLKVPESDRQQREREIAEGAREAGWTANILELIMAQDPVVEIDTVDDFGQPWFTCEVMVDGQLEQHTLAVMDDDSWERYVSAPKTLYIIPVLPSLDIERDLAWYEKYTGFTYAFGDQGYAGLKRDQLEFHLQFHHGNEEDPITGGSVMKIFVSDIQPYFEEFVGRGTITKEKLRMNTPWGTHEFGFYDLNKNAIFIVQDV